MLYNEGHTTYLHPETSEDKRREKKSEKSIQHKNRKAKSTDNEEKSIFITHLDIV